MSSNVRILQVGTPGSAGESGASGYSGYSGFSGDNPGSSGYSGFSGRSGYSGYSGYSGFSGTGTQGLSGFTGYSGTSGFTGFSGKSGYSGFSGSSGFTGFSGLSGYSGNASGYSGFSGASGDSPGSSGFSGYSGASGYSGFTGTSGYSGFSGAGLSGYSGYTGTSGASGISGPSGWSGVSGWSGRSGYSGYSGYSGRSGYSGNKPGASGFSGFSGRSGYSGYSGISGFSGAPNTGASGFSGFSGKSGYSGYSGTSGYSGFSSTSGYSGFSGAGGGGGTSGFSGFTGVSGYSGYSGISGYSGFTGFSGVGTSGFSGFSGTAGGGTNPTTLFVPYNNAGTFADSNLKRASTDLTEVIRSTNAQTLNFYKSFVSATEYQRLKIDCSHASGIRLVADYQNAVGINILLGNAGASDSVLIGSADMYPTTTRSYNLGGSSNLWNQAYAYVFISNNASDTSGGGFSFSGGPDMFRTASGTMEIKDPTGAFNKIHLGLGQANVNVAFVKPASVQYIESRTGDETALVYHVSAGGKFTSAQFDKTNTTLADVTGLTSEALTAGRTYGFEALLFVDADVVGGSKYAIAGTATATAIKYEIVFISDAANSMVITSRQTALAGSAGQAGTTAGICRISGTITVNAAGTLTVQFAQNAANGTSSVLTMSNFRVWQIN